MELIGTFALCYIGGLSVAFNNTKGLAGSNLTNIALAHGLVLGIFIYIGARISGAHYNPAVTVALIAIRKCHPVEGVLFICSQFFGSILAGLLIILYSGGTTCGCPNGVGAYSGWQGAICEFIATWFLMFVIMGTAVDPNAHKGVYGAAIGGTLTMCIFGIGPVTGAALNPFRAYGPQLAGLITNFGTVSLVSNAVWIYVFPFLGAVTAALMYDVMFLRRSSNSHEIRVEVDLELKI